MILLSCYSSIQIKIISLGQNVAIKLTSMSFVFFEEMPNAFKKKILISPIVTIFEIFLTYSYYFTNAKDFIFMWNCPCFINFECCESYKKCNLIIALN